MRKFVVVLLAAGCLAVLGATLSMPLPGQVDLQAQKTCDPKVEKCDTGTPCSPGYWKNHLTEFNLYCDEAAAGSSFADCDELLDALTCKGSDASCKRSLAAAAMNSVSGCTE